MEEGEKPRATTEDQKEIRKVAERKNKGRKMATAVVTEAFPQEVAFEDRCERSY